MPITGHPAYEKAAEMLKIKVVKVKLDKQTLKVNLKKVEKKINKNTIMLIGSAYNFPHGIIDPIKELGKLAIKHKIGLHVDCCLGGLILPFAKQLGYDLPEFDFMVEGVTAISVDTHKYGYSCKGSSVILYKT